MKYPRNTTTKSMRTTQMKQKPKSHKWKLGGSTLLLLSSLSRQDGRRSWVVSSVAATGAVVAVMVAETVLVGVLCQCNALVIDHDFTGQYHKKIKIQPKMDYLTTGANELVTQ